jgi:prepilin-type processing-associated H-X9-DG protein
VLGEKEASTWDYYVDMVSLDDLRLLDQTRHGGNGRGGKSGVANYLFADGSARPLAPGRCLAPLNLWAITDFYRNSAVTLP